MTFRILWKMEPSHRLSLRKCQEIGRTHAVLHICAKSALGAELFELGLTDFPLAQRSLKIRNINLARNEIQSQNNVWRESGTRAASFGNLFPVQRDPARFRCRPKLDLDNALHTDLTLNVGIERLPEAVRSNDGLGDVSY